MQKTWAPISLAPPTAHAAMPSSAGTAVPSPRGAQQTAKDPGSPVVIDLCTSDDEKDPQQGQQLQQQDVATGAHSSKLYSPEAVSNGVDQSSDSAARPSSSKDAHTKVASPQGDQPAPDKEQDEEANRPSKKPKPALRELSSLALDQSFWGEGRGKRGAGSRRSQEPAGTNGHRSAEPSEQGDSSSEEPDDIPLVNPSPKKKPKGSKKHKKHKSEHDSPASMQLVPHADPVGDMVMSDPVLDAVAAELAIHVSKVIDACFPDGPPLEVLGAKLAPTAAKCFRGLLDRAIADLQNPKAAMPPTAQNCRDQLLCYVCASQSTVYDQTRDIETKMSAQNITTRSQQITRQIEDAFVDMLIHAAAQQMRKNPERLTAVDVLRHLPCTVGCYPAFKQYIIPDNDPRVGLRGELGVKAVKEVQVGTIMGPYSGFQMFAAEYRQFFKNPPARLIRYMMDQLNKKHKGQQIGLPGPLAPYLAELYYINEEICQEVVIELIRACQLEKQVVVSKPKPHKGKGKHKHSSAGNDSDSAAPEPIWLGYADELVKVLHVLMMAQLRSGMERSQLDIPAHFQEDPDIIDQWLDVEDAVWMLHCDSYGADVETANTLGRSGKESLTTILQDVASAEVINKLVQNSSITTTAIREHHNLMARVNDPACDLPGEQEGPGQDASVKKYEQQSACSNCYQLVIQVVGWPLLFLVTRKKMNKDNVCSYQYGLHYWTNVFEKRDLYDRTVAHLQERLENKKLKHLLAERDRAREVSEQGGGVGGGPSTSSNLRATPGNSEPLLLCDRPDNNSNPAMVPAAEGATTLEGRTSSNTHRMPFPTFNKAVGVSRFQTQANNTPQDTHAHAAEEGAESMSELRPPHVEHTAASHPAASAPAFAPPPATQPYHGLHPLAMAGARSLMSAGSAPEAFRPPAFQPPPSAPPTLPSFHSAPVPGAARPAWPPQQPSVAPPWPPRPAAAPAPGFLPRAAGPNPYIPMGAPGGPAFAPPRPPTFHPPGPFPPGPFSGFTGARGHAPSVLGPPRPFPAFTPPGSHLHGAGVAGALPGHPLVARSVAAELHQGLGGQQQPAQPAEKVVIAID